MRQTIGYFDLYEREELEAAVDGMGCDTARNIHVIKSEEQKMHSWANHIAYWYFLMNSLFNMPIASVIEE